MATPFGLRNFPFSPEAVPWLFVPFTFFHGGATHNNHVCTQEGAPLGSGCPPTGGSSPGQET